jgi:hypothetical protein
MKIIVSFFLLITFQYGYIGAVDNDYVGFTSKTNKDGLTLISTGTMYEVRGFGPGTEYIEQGFSRSRLGLVIYLGKECDAFSKLYGTGHWAWANGGFEIVFTSKRFGFGRQEIDMSHILDMDMGKCEM